MTTTEKEIGGAEAVHQVPKSMGEVFLDFAGVIVKRRIFLVRFVISATIVTTIVALLLPKWYRATASVFPAEQANLFSAFEGVSSLVKTLSGGSKKLGGITGSSEADRYVAILKSDRVMSAMIRKFNLLEVYEYTFSSFPNEKTAKELENNTSIELQDEGNLTVSVFDKDPARAAEMANFYIELLNETNSELMVQNAKGNREFVEQRYQKNLVDLRTAEEAMKDFQVKYGVMAVPEQAEASIKAGAELYGQLAGKEIQLEVLKRSASESHPSVTAAEIEVQEIRKKIREVNSGSFGVGDNMRILIPLKMAPQLAADYVRLYRELQIQNKILEFITPLFEQAKVEEHRSTPSVVVLDHASTPEHKAKPKIALFALLGLVISTLFALFVIFSAEGLERLRIIHPGRLESIFSSVRSDWFGLKHLPWKNGSES